MLHYELLKVCSVFTPVYTRPKKKEKEKRIPEAVELQ